MTVHIASIVQTPYLVEDDGRLLSETRLAIVNDGDPVEAWAEVAVAGRKPVLQPLGRLAGTGEVTVRVPELTEEREEVGFALLDAAERGTVLAHQEAVQQRIRHWSVYVVHDTHVDIGYTHHQDELRMRIWPEQIDDALRAIDETAGWADDDRFRLQLESSYLLYGSWLDARDADQTGRLVEALQSTRLGYSASVANSSTEAMGTEELVRYYYYSSRYLPDRLGAGSTGVVMVRDNPSLSWSNIDIFDDIGLRYLYLGFNLNSRTPMVITDAYPRLLVIEGRRPDRSVIAFDGPLYNLDEMEFVPNGDEGTEPELQVTVDAVASTIMSKFQTERYVGDAVVTNATQYWDNGALYPEVRHRIRAMNSRTDADGRPYVWPRFVNSNMRDFFDHVASGESANRIPRYRGTIENWWNYGIPADAWAAGRQRRGQNELPPAETLATLASVLHGVPYPADALRAAWDSLMLYDEHSFGGRMDGLGSVSDHHVWKRNHAIAPGNTAADLTADAVRELTSSTGGSTARISVVNSLAWTRTGAVRVAVPEDTEEFVLVDVADGSEVAYERNGALATFVARDVPGLGYRTYELRAGFPSDPEPSIGATGRVVENAYFRVELDARGGIASILDKSAGGRELVDHDAPWAANEFLYLISDVDRFDVRSEHRVEETRLTASNSPVRSSLTSVGECEGTRWISRTVTLYADLPVIEIHNEVHKAAAPPLPGGQPGAVLDEEGFFTFPFRVPDFVLRSEMPSGDVRPHVTSDIDDPATEQFYTSSTDFYTVNRWIDATSESAGYGVSLYPYQAPVVQYGSRRSLLYDIDYNTPTPWVMSYVYCNKWCTNFIESQPGPATFDYRIRSHTGSDWRAGRADRHGLESVTPLVGRYFAGDGSAMDEPVGQWLGLDADGVHLTTAKLAEPNGDGFVVRLVEMLGHDTLARLDLSRFGPVSVVQTSLVEDDRHPVDVVDGVVAVDVPAYGWTTLRIVTECPVPVVEGVRAATVGTDGTVVTWSAVPEATCYEVFRAPAGGPGGRVHVATVSEPALIDRQVRAGGGAYEYSVRVVGRGAKGAFSEPVVAREGDLPVLPVAGKPRRLRADYTSSDRISLSWLPPQSRALLAGYRIYRDGELLIEHPAMLTSHLDAELAEGRRYAYCVTAFDVTGRESEESNAVFAVSEVKPPVA
jgi:glycosyl hydrolase family 38